MLNIARFIGRLCRSEYRHSREHGRGVVRSVVYVVVLGVLCVVDNGYTGE